MSNILHRKPYHHCLGITGVGTGYCNKKLLDGSRLCSACQTRNAKVSGIRTVSEPKFGR